MKIWTNRQKWAGWALLGALVVLMNLGLFSGDTKSSRSLNTPAPHVLSSATQDTSNAVLLSVWYNLKNGVATNVVYSAKRKKEFAFYHKDTGRVTIYSADLSDPFGKRTEAEWKRIFRQFETDGSIPTLPLSFLSGEGTAMNVHSTEIFQRIDFSEESRLTQEIVLKLFGDIPTERGAIFKVAKIIHKGESALAPVELRRKGVGYDFCLYLR